MAAAIALRGDCDPRRLRALAKQSGDADQTRRRLALATIYDGGSRGEAAELAGVGLQTVRDWVLRFNADGVAGLVKPQGSWETTAAERGAAARAGGGD